MPWYAIQTHTGFESRVAARLALEGVETYWPSHERKETHRRKDQVTRAALFPGYLFASLQGRLSTDASHIVRVVSYGGRPVIIPELEISSVRILEASPTVEPCSFFVAGQPVYIRRGPLAGIFGVVDHRGKHSRIVVSVTMLARSASAEVEEEWLEMAKTPTLARAA